MTNTDSAVENTVTIPGWYWAVAGIALVWNLLGVMAFILHLMMTPEMLAQLPEAQRALYQNYPGWLNYAYGAAVIGGALGCVALLMKNAFAFQLFVISLVGVLVQDYYSFFQTNLVEVMGISSVVMPSIVIIVAIGLIVFSQKMKAKGILN